MRQRWIRGRYRGIAAAVAAVFVLALPAGASAYEAQLKRYPYLTDVVGTSAILNFGTDISSINAVVKYGRLGTEPCDTNTAAATRTFILVNGVSEYQWKAPLAGLLPDTEYCYRVYFGTAELDLLGTDPTPSFRTQVPAGSTQPFKFAVFGDWGKVHATGNPDQANVISQIAQSGARFALTTGDNAYEVGSQKDYGDLYQTGLNTSAVFGPDFWTVAGKSMPLFPAIGNHDHNNSVMLTNWPQDTAVATSSGRYQTDTYCCLNETTSADYPSMWYAFDSGLARFYVLHTAWNNSNVGTADQFKNDYDYHWAPGTPQYEWLKNDLATHPRALKFAFFHYPFYSDSSENGSNPHLRGPASLEGLLNLHDVNAAFQGHSHNYQRNDTPPGGIPTHVTGGGGANLESIGKKGCGPLNLYGIGWSNTSNVGSACGSAPVPVGKDEVHHFLLVSVNGSSVTVTPTDELGRTFDPVTYNAPAMDSDLEISKSDSPDPVLVGQPLTYTLDVHNAGPRSATGVQVTDTLPSGVTFNSATPSQGTCSQLSGTVSCSLGTIGNGADAAVEIVVTPQSAGTITNQATVASDINDPDATDNSASADTTVDPAADLSLTKADSPDPVLLGEELTYTLDVANAGPDSASTVSLTDTLPVGATFESATPSQGTCSEAGGTVTCALGNIAAAGTATVEIKVRPQTLGAIANDASVTSLTGDPDGTDNAASADTTVEPAADLSLTKGDSPDPVLEGQELTYTLDVGNAGPSTATDVTLTDTLPAGVTFNSATPSQGTCSESSGTVSCSVGTVANAASASVEIKVTPQSVGTLSNTASVSSSVADPVAGNNSANAGTTVDPVADLSLTKSDSPDPVLAGQLLTYTLTAQNSGPSTATGVELTDTLPASVTFESATPTQGTCSEASGTVTCALGSVANGANAGVEIKVRPQASGSITNEADVSSTAADSNSANNSASTQTTVNPAADLELTKVDSPDPVLIDELLTYTLTVHNAGPSSAGSVGLSDPLPSGVNFHSVTTSQGTCSLFGSTVTCALGTLANQADATVTIKVRPQNAGTVNNTASVVSVTTDTDSSDNSAGALTTVNPAADLSLTKTDSPDPVLAGELLTYTLDVHNGGPQSAANVTLTDTLPAGVTYESATPTQGTCSEAAGTVTCALGTLADEGDATVVIEVRSPSSGTITNEADVSSDATDTNPGDNSASAETTVDPAADLSLTKTDSPDPVLAGELLTYTLDVQNAGPSDAAAVSVGDTLPAGVTFESATPSQGTCAEASGTVTCDLGTIAAQAGTTVVIEVRPQAPGPITNDATVLSLTADPDSSDNAASAETSVSGAANLAVTKSDSPDPAFVGETLTYSLDVQNAGPQDATAATLTDTLPGGVTFESATPSQGSCSEASGTVTCELGTIASGQGATIAVDVTPQAAGSITNEADVTSDVADPDSADNSASAETTVDPVADLSLSKSDTPDPVLAGEPITYTLMTQNAGPSSATAVQLTDTLPAGVTYGSATPSQGSCSEASGTVTCDLGTIDSGQDASVEIEIRAFSPGTITNDATVASDVHDPASENNTAAADTTVDPAADLSLTKSDAPDPVLVGESLVYTLTVENAGPQDATGVTLTDNLPFGASFESATPSQGSCFESGGTVTCELETIPNGQGASVEITVTPENEGQITNEASVGSGIGDPNTADNSATAATTVRPVADLELTKTDSPDPVAAGQELTYTLTVHNSGPQDAGGVTLTDTLPAGATFESATPTQGDCAEADGTVTCDLGTLANAGDATAEIKVRHFEPGTITNEASVTTDAHDPNPANNEASAETTVDPAADLSITKSDSPDPVLAGELLTYTIDVANAGPQEATGVTVADTLPAGVTYVSATPSQGSCSESSGTVICALGTLADGAGADVQIEVRPLASGTITNQANVLSFVADPDSGNNSAAADTTVDAAADLSLTKSDSPDPALVGGTLTYDLEVQNSGPQSATGVTVTDTLPADVAYQSATPSQGTCSEAGGTVTCELGTIADAATASVAIDVTPQTAGEVTNEAGVTSETADPDSGDTTASAVTTVRPVADLALTKSDSPDPVLAGQLLTYTLTVDNGGPQDAEGVTLTDTLPAGVSYESSTPSQGTCAEAGGTVTCELGTIADQGTASVEIEVRAPEPGTITNDASVTSDAHDPDSGNDSASAETTVDPAADLSITKSDSPDPVLAGELVTYTLSVQNAGPQAATGVTVADTLPAGVTFDSATSSQGTCLEASGTVTCALGTIASEASATVEIRVRPSAAGTLNNQASILAETGDPDPGDNSAAAQTTVSATPVGYPRPRGATPLRTSLVVAYEECAAANRTHAPPLDSPACNPPAARSDFLTVGTPDANSNPANLIGSLRLAVLNGDVGTPADEADVLIAASVTDVRDRTTFADYAGELQAQMSLRMTDRLNGTTLSDTATGSDITYAFPVPCTPTGGAANVGSTCSVTTTADAILAGTVTEIKRTIWQLGDVRVLDGGADGDAETADNTLFLRQGIFIP